MQLSILTILLQTRVCCNKSFELSLAIETPLQFSKTCRLYQINTLNSIHYSIHSSLQMELSDIYSTK